MDAYVPAAQEWLTTTFAMKRKIFLTVTKLVYCGVQCPTVPMYLSLPNILKVNYQRKELSSYCVQVWMTKRNQF